MKYCTAFALLTVAVLAGLVYRQYARLTAIPALPVVNLNEYWGPEGRDNKPNTATVLQEIRYPFGPVEQLIQQLNQTLYFQPPLQDVKGFEYGFNTDFLREFVDYWRDEYLKYWPSREIVLNRMPHFKTNIQG